MPPEVSISDFDSSLGFIRYGGSSTRLSVVSTSNSA